jgi:hypothetical protein
LGQPGSLAIPRDKAAICAVIFGEIDAPSGWCGLRQVTGVVVVNAGWPLN